MAHTSSGLPAAGGAMSAVCRRPKIRAERFLGDRLRTDSSRFLGDSFGQLRTGLPPLPTRCELPQIVRRRPACFCESLPALHVTDKIQEVHARYAS
jgi:hypothetical protein